MSCLLVIGMSAKDDPKVTSVHILDATEKTVEICFSEPVNIKNLGWMVASIQTEAIPMRLLIEKNDLSYASTFLRLMVVVLLVTSCCRKKSN